jgi:hypothetical protein
MFETRKALTQALNQAVKENKISQEDATTINRALIFFPRKRRAVLDAVEEQLALSDAISEDGTYGDWMLIITLIIQFLPVLLELLEKLRN